MARRRQSVVSYSDTPSKVLLTGGTGFIALHVLDALLGRGYTVVTTFEVVQNVAQLDAFDAAVISDPPFDAVVHTASPFAFDAKEDIQRELIDPAVNGTLGILKAVHSLALTVKRVVILSSFAAMESRRKSLNHIYSETDWNDITPEEAVQDPVHGYCASKTFAERATWEFVEREKPRFDVVALNPSLVFGPIHLDMQSLDNLDTGVAVIRNFVDGTHKAQMPLSIQWLWVDVRDLAKAHVAALETPAAGGSRYFITAGHFSHKLLAEVIRAKFPEYASQLPSDLSPGDFPPADQLMRYNNIGARRVLGIEGYTAFEKTVVDTIESLEPLLKQ